MNNLKSLFLALVLIISALYLIKILDISYPLTIVSTSKTNELAVVGEAKMEVVPDTAYVNLSITTQGSQVSQVREKIDKVNDALIKELKQLGIKKEEIKTTNYSVYPNYDYTSGQKIVDYTGTVSLQVKIKNFSLIPNVLERAEKVGFNQIGGVNFTVDQPEVYREKVREKAIENARKQASKLAKSLGIKLGRITNIVESSPKESIEYQRTVGAGGPSSPIVEPGTETIYATVTLYFEKEN